MRVLQHRPRCPYGLALVAAASLSLSGCLLDLFKGGDDDEEQSSCLDELPTDCRPAFSADYDGVFDDLLAPTCGASSTGSDCHGPEGQTALPLHSRSGAYGALLGDLDGTYRVVPGLPRCSALVRRLHEGHGGDERTLSPGVRCAVQQWIRDGAERD